jgi:hypothetical protein
MLYDITIYLIRDERSVKFRFRERYLHFPTSKRSIVQTRYCMEAILYGLKLYQSHILLPMTQNLDTIHLSKLLKNIKQFVLSTHFSLNRWNMESFAGRIDRNRFIACKSIRWSVKIAYLRVLVLFRLSQDSFS